MSTKLDALTLEQLTDYVSHASGWNHAEITFVKGERGVTAAVEICGAKTTVTAHSHNHKGALVALLKNIEMHHSSGMRWEETRLRNVRKILDELDVYYVGRPHKPTPSHLSTIAIDPPPADR